MMNKMAQARKAKCYTVPMQYAGDNAAMIAYTGSLQYKTKKEESVLEFYPRQRIDEIETYWK
jgi:N6-L-threonylcarbamoyladenine synthase